MSLITVAYPESWLSWTISIVNIATEVEDFSGEITEIWTTKVYKYEFTEVVWESYVFIVTVPWYDEYVDSIIYEVSGSGGGLTIDERERLFSLPTSVGWVWIGNNVLKKINEAKDEIIAKIEEIPQVSLVNIENILNETNSHITLATDDILNTIKESETEICSDIIRSKKEIKEDNVSTRQLVRQKTEKLDKNISKLVDRQILTDKTIEDEADSIEEELEQIYMQEADNIETEIEDQYKKEAQDIEDEINKEINS